MSRRVVRSSFAEKSKNSFPEIRRNENKWVKIRLEHQRKLLVGRLLNLSHGVSPVTNAVVTFVNVLPINQSSGPVQINVDLIKTIRLDRKLNHHFNKASKEIQNQIITALGGGEEEEEEVEVVGEREREEEWHMEEPTFEDEEDYTGLMMVEEEEERFNQIDSLFREVELEWELTE